VETFRVATAAMSYGAFDKQFLSNAPGIGKFDLLNARERKLG
jgi:hypothetical protein